MRGTGRGRSREMRSRGRGRRREMRREERWRRRGRRIRRGRRRRGKKVERKENEETLFQCYCSSSLSCWEWQEAGVWSAYI